MMDLVVKHHQSAQQLQNQRERSRSQTVAGSWRRVRQASAAVSSEAVEAIIRQRRTAA